MLKHHARLLFIVSVLLLAIVTLDFVQVGGKNTNQTPVNNAKTNVTQAVDQIGKVLASCSPCLIIEFYLKDASDNSFISGATVNLQTRDPFDFPYWNFTEYCKSLGCIYSLDAGGDGGVLKVGQSFPDTVQISISKTGYDSKTALIHTGNTTVDTAYLDKVAIVAPAIPVPATTTVKKTTSVKTVETIKDVLLPAEFKAPGSETTDLSKITDSTKVPDLEIDSSLNSIKFTENVDLSSTDTKDKFKELDKYVTIKIPGVISIDSLSLPVLNKRATLTMRGLKFVKTPRVLVNGKDDPTVVTIKSYKDGVLVFDVTHFSTFTAAPTVGINEPADNFETSNKTVTLKGTVSDPNATVSATLNNKDLGKLKIASSSGEFSTDATLDEGLNKIVVSALAATGITAVASVSGTLIKAATTNIGAYLILFILALIAGFGLVYSGKHLMKKKPVSEPKKPDQPNPPADQIT